MVLPEELNRKPYNEIIKYEEVKKNMPHITTAEKIGMEKGIQQGIQQGVQQGVQQGRLQNAREAILENLEARFEVVPRSVIKRIDQIEELSLLKILHKKSVVVDSLEEFKEVLAKLME